MLSVVKRWSMHT